MAAVGWSLGWLLALVLATAVAVYLTSVALRHSLFWFDAMMAWAIVCMIAVTLRRRVRLKCA